MASNKDGTLTLKLHINGVRETLRAFRDLPPEAATELRKQTLEISQWLAERIKTAGTADTKQSALVAQTVRARRDRVPAIVAGGARRVGRKKNRASDLVYGSEFGMNARSGWYANPRFAGAPGRQFRPHQGQDSYWFYTTAEANQDAIDRAWNRVADDVLRQFSHG